MRLDGFISLASVTLRDGLVLSAAEAVRRGIVDSQMSSTEEWPKLGPSEVPVGVNLHTNAGRQLMIYCWGNRPNIADFACSQFGIGTGTTPPTVDDLDLENPVEFTPGNLLKSVNSIDYPEPYIARVSLTISDTEAVGELISEFGLYSGNGTLLNRSVLDVAFNQSGVSKTYLWRLRF